MTTLGVYGKRHNPVTTLWHTNVDKQARDRQMPCKRSHPSQRKFADLGACRDHGWVHRCWRYSLAVMKGKRAFRRRALWRLHPACREVTCGDTDMDWPRPWAVLHTTGLWGRSYLRVGRRAASRARQSTLLNGRHGFTEGENLPWMIACRESSHTDTWPSTRADRRPGRAITSTGPGVRLLHQVWLWGVQEELH